MKPDPGQHAADSERHFRILCLEDNEHDRVLIEECLRAHRLSFDLVHVTSRDDFERALRERSFDMVLSDYSIPGYSGMEALATARARWPDVPFLVVSGTIGEERAVESLKSGAADYVLKERLDRLAPAVRRALREAEERRRRKFAEESLKESEARFRQLAENIGEVLWLMDAKTGGVLYVSPAYEKIWGRSVESLYAQPRSWADTIVPEDRDRVLDALLSPGAQWHHDDTYRILRPDGSMRWIRDQVFPITNDAGEVYRLVRVAADVTNTRQLEGQLRQAQKMEAVGQLAGGVAHDFNNLLCVIRGNADLVLADAGGLSEKNRDCLSQIAAASERAARLTRQLLAFGRKQVIQPEPLNLNDLIANLEKMFKRVIPENIRFQCDFDLRQPHVLADSGMLEQVLLNLVLNARDAMPEGGTLTMETELVHLDAAEARANAEAREGDFVILKVADTGTGIAPQHLPRMFEPFFTTKGVHKGTGLGLATAYGIVKQHRGWIEVSSPPGQGATFKILLPAIPPPRTDTSELANKAKLRGGHETILVVEDDPSVRSLTRRTLEMFGYKVLEASSAADAIRLSTSGAERADLLLTDVVIPGGINGDELARQLVAGQPKLKVVFMSGYGRDVTRHDTEFIRKTAAAFLQKPHSSSMLIDTIRRCLDAA